LVWPLNCGSVSLQRQHERHAVPDVFRRQLDAARQQVAEIAELAQRIGEAGAQAVDVGAALRGGIRLT
jgi:hypothetical protein